MSSVLLLAVIISLCNFEVCLFRDLTVMSKSKSSQAEEEWQHLIEISRVHDHESFARTPKFFSSISFFPPTPTLCCDDSTFELGSSYKRYVLFHFSACHSRQNFSLLMTSMIIRQERKIFIPQASSHWDEYGLTNIDLGFISSRSDDLFDHVEHEINLKTSF